MLCYGGIRFADEPPDLFCIVFIDCRPFPVRHDDSLREYISVVRLFPDTVDNRVSDSLLAGK